MRFAGYALAGSAALDVGTDPAEALAPLRPQLEALVARDVEAEIARLVGDLVGVQVERLNGAGEATPGTPPAPRRIAQKRANARLDT